MTANKTTIISVIVGLLILSAAAYMFFMQGENADVLTSDGGPVSSSEFTFINLAAEIEPITFDTSILQDPRFLRLVDLRTAILPETSGRTDPFAPLGR